MEYDDVTMAPPDTGIVPNSGPTVASRTAMVIGRLIERASLQLIEILRAEAGAARLDEVRPVLSSDDVLEMQEQVKKIRVDESLVNYTLEIVNKTRQSEQLSLGVSPRGSLMLYRSAQAMAFLEGRKFTTPDDFKRLAVPVFAHRVVVNARYSSTLKTSEQAERIVSEIVENVAVPS